MVMMYQARRTRLHEERAVASTQEFVDFMRGYVQLRRNKPADDLITHLIAAEQDGKRLSTDELITTCILLLNAGHEATAHTIGNGIKCLLEEGFNPSWFSFPEAVDKTIEEILEIKTQIAFDEFKKVSKKKNKTFVIAGGVAANKGIRKELIKVCKKNDFRPIFPEPKLCGDNAAMIALVGLEKYKIKKFDKLDLPASPRLPLDEKAKFLKGAGVRL